MEEKKPTPKYTAEFRDRGVRLYREHRWGYTSDGAAYKARRSFEQYRPAMHLNRPSRWRSYGRMVHLQAHR